jgi:hypothetical protein
MVLQRCEQGGAGGIGKWLGRRSALLSVGRWNLVSGRWREVNVPNEAVNSLKTKIGDFSAEIEAVNTMKTKRLSEPKPSTS